MTFQRQASTRPRERTRRFQSAVRSQVRAGSSAAVDLAAYDRWPEPVDPDARAVPAPITLATSVGPSALVLEDAESIPMAGALQTFPDEDHTVDGSHELFVDPTDGLVLSTFPPRDRLATLSRAESMCLPSQANVAARRPRRRPKAIDPVVFEMSDHARAQLGPVDPDDDDVWA
jgi:hypothetical protein